MPSKILIVFPFPIVGGIETLFATLLKKIPKDIDYITAVPNGFDAKWALTHLDPYAKVIGYNNGEDLAPKIDFHNPQLIVGAMNYHLSGALKLCRKPYRVVETSHNVLSSAVHSLEIVRPWVSHVICVSRSVQEHVIKNTRFSGPSSVILTGVDTDVFRPREALNATCRNYAYFGRLCDADKSVSKLFEAFLHMRDVNLNLYGRAHTDKEQEVYERLLNERYKGAGIVLKGFVEEPAKHYVQNDVIVVRSEAEGFCNTAIEAFACGIPLVAYNFGGVLDHVPPRTCLIANDQAEFKQHLRAIRAFPLRMELRANAMAFVHKECRADVMAHRYHKVFTKLLEPTRIELSSEAPRVASVCTQYSTSIVHAMAEYQTDVHQVDYSDRYDDDAYRKLLRYDKIIFNAAGKAYNQLILRLASQGKEVYGIYHSGFCGFSFDHLFNESERANLQSMLDLQRSGALRKVGFVNKGSADFYSRLGYNTAWTPDIPELYRCPGSPKDGIHIGVFSAMNAMKNSSAAVACALAIPGSIVHVTAPPVPWPGMDMRRVVVHGWMKKNDLLELMGQMQVTLMLSFTESYGLLVTQSWSVGTPCVVGPACAPLLGDDADLIRTSYVPRLDDGETIVNSIVQCMGERERLQTCFSRRLSALYKEGHAARKEFLE